MDHWTIFLIALAFLHFRCSLLVATQTIALSMVAARTSDAEVDVNIPAPGSGCVICKKRTLHSF